VFGAGPGGLVEGAAGPELNRGRNDQNRRHQDIHRIQREWDVHQRHEAEADWKRDHPPTLQVVDLPLAITFEFIGGVVSYLRRFSGLDSA